MPRDLRRVIGQRQLVHRHEGLRRGIAIRHPAAYAALPLMSDKPSNPPSRAYALMIGVFLIGHVIWLFYLGLTDTFDGPPWVAYVMGVIFLTGAAQLLAMAWGHAGRGKWVAFVWLVGFSTLFWWVALAGDPRKCSASIGPFSLPLGCKVPFGFFALIFTAYTIHVARVWFLPRRKSYY